jgi:hypothetical protein
VVVPIVTASPREGTFAAGNQYYDADLSGFRDYLETIRGRNPTLYAKLDAKLDSIENDRTLAHVLSWGVGCAHRRSMQVDT